MLADEKILITGLTGQIAFPMAAHLAQNNEVWGLARYSQDGSRERVEAVGVKAHRADLANGDYGDLPDDFTYLVHLAAFQSPGVDYDWALQVNAEGTGMLMHHCRRAKAALVASTFSVYKPNPDPNHPYVETDPLGDCNALHAPTYSMSKIGQEAVARVMSRALGLPTTIARINAAYSSHGGLPAYHLDWIMEGKPVGLRGGFPTPYSVIHQDDMNAHVEPFLEAATTPATVVNWCGDEAVNAEDWIAYLGELSGRETEVTYADYPGTPPGAAGDTTKRRSITGPCRVGWRDGFRELWETRYPGGVKAEGVAGGAANLQSAYGSD